MDVRNIAKGLDCCSIKEQFIMKTLSKAENKRVQMIMNSYGWNPEE